MEISELEELEAVVESIFESTVQETTEGAEMGFPPLLFNVKKNGKDQTKSSITGYETCGSAFAYHMPLRRTSSGVGAEKTVKGGVVIVYALAGDLLEVEYTTMFMKGLKFELTLIDPHDVNDTKSTRKGFVYKGCTFLTHPIPLTANCKAILCTFESFDSQAGEVDPESGDPKGNKDVASFNFSKGGA